MSTPDTATPTSLRSETRATIRDPIAIGGCGSSGTSLLREIMDAHPEVACGKELSAFDRPATYEMTIEELSEVYESQTFDRMDEGMPFPIQLQDGSSYFGLKRGGHGESYHRPAETRALLAESESVSEFWNRYLTHHARKEGKRIWAEKTPGNVFFAEEFLSWYPEGRFINVVRNGRDVCLSLVKRRKFPLKDAVIRWILSIEAGLAIRDHERSYEIRYEDLTSDPEGELRDLCDWLDLEFTPTMLEFYKNDIDNQYGYGTQPVHEKSKGRWERSKDEIDPTARYILKHSLRRHMEAMGYEG